MWADGVLSTISEALYISCCAKIIPYIISFSQSNAVLNIYTNSAHVSV